ncbi:MAG: M28 family peptidase [Acidimicrobiales bacterium]
MRATRFLSRIVVSLLLAATLSACTPVHVWILASDGFGGRNNGSPGSSEAQHYLLSYLRAVGVEALDGTTESSAYLHPMTGGVNVVGRIPGTDLADEIVVVGAHYDHLASCDQQGGDTICNGATDNAAGTAVVLEIARALAQAKDVPRRTVIIGFWDREEDGLLEAKHGRRPIPVSSPMRSPT